MLSGGLQAGGQLGAAGVADQLAEGAAFQPQRRRRQSSATLATGGGPLGDPAGQDVAAEILPGGGPAELVG